MILHNESVAQSGAPLEEAQKILVMIHGRGDTAQGFINDSQRLHISTSKYAIVAPQAIGHTWYPHGFMEPNAMNHNYH
jgi:phospholipase/carboxylesterase